MYLAQFAAQQNLTEAQIQMLRHATIALRDDDSNFVAHWKMCVATVMQKNTVAQKIHEYSEWLYTSKLRWPRPEDEINKNLGQITELLTTPGLFELRLLSPAARREFLDYFSTKTHTFTCNKAHGIILKSLN